MKTVILMRHSKAVPESESGRDFDRPLSEKGQAMVEQTADLMVEEGISIDRVLTSSAVRTLQTAQALAKVVCPDAPFHAIDQLYLSPVVSLLSTLKLYSTANDRTVLLVGHNPGIAELMQHWSGKSLSVSPCTVLVLDIDTDDWQSLSVFLPQTAVTRWLIQKARNCS